MLEEHPHFACEGVVVVIYGAMPSFSTIDVVSPLGLGAVERSPHYALQLNAEPLTSHIDDGQLSAGSR